MALSKEWKERYLTEMAKAHERMAEIAKLYPDWHFEPPKTLPRNDYEAARRITDFKRVNIAAFRAASTPRYVVYWTNVAIPTRKGEKREVKKGTKYTRKQVDEALKAWEREVKAWRKLGLEGEPAKYTPGTKIGREKYIANRKASNVMYNVQKKGNMFKRNLLKSLHAQKGRFIDMGIEEMVTVTDRIIEKISGMDYVSVWNTLRPYISGDGSSDLFKIELFGSEYNTLSESNLDKVAMILGLSTQTEVITEEELKADEERRAAIREQMMKDPPF